MTHFKDPFDASTDVWSECGETGAPVDDGSARAHLAAEDQAFLARRAAESLNDDLAMARSLESAVMRGVFKTDPARRTFLRATGAASAYALISQFFPLASLQSMAQEARRNIEKPNLSIGFVPITCATPLIGAHALGFYQRYGLNVDIVKTAGWAVARDKCLNGEYDGSHLLFPMPAAMSMGVGSTAQQWRVISNVNTNGQAIVLHNNHRDKRDPRQWRGFRFAVPFVHSMHNYLLRTYVAEVGLDPDRDIQIRVTPPPEMVANLRAGNIDGYLAPDPFCQRAVFDGVGFIYMLTRDLWAQHPCCVLGLSQRFITENPNTFIALSTAVLEATAVAETAQGRTQFAEAIAPANYLNQPVEVLRQILTGIYPDGLGNIRRVPDRISFMPLPTQTMGIWVLSQMRRWGIVREEIRYEDLAKQIFLSGETAQRMREMQSRDPNLRWPDLTDDFMQTVTVQGRRFNPREADAFNAGFAIHRL